MPTDNSFDNLISKAVAAEENDVTPTLMVGLGGTGARVLRYVKKFYADSESNRSNIRLCAIDTDRNENNKYPHLPTLDQSELLVLDCNQAVNVLKRAENNETDCAHIREFLPLTKSGLFARVRAKIEQGVGAGQFRRAGRLFFCANTYEGTNVAAELLKLKNQLGDMQKNMEEKRQGRGIKPGVCVYVICSIAGGTGSGSLMDCLALLRQTFTDATDKIIAICLLPGPLLDLEFHNDLIQKEQTRGIALGVLRELQGIQLHKLNGLEFKFNDRHSFKVTGASPFASSVFLVDHSVMSGRQADNWLGLCGAIGSFLYAQNGTGVGSSIQSQAVNLPEQETNTSEKFPPVFSALGVGMLSYPVRDLRVFGTLYRVNKWLDKWLAVNPNLDSHAAQLLTRSSLLITNSKQFKDRFSVPVGEADPFLPVDRNSMMGLTVTDADFFGKANTKVPYLEAILSEEIFQKKLEIKAKNVATETIEAIQKRLDALFSESLAHTLNCFVALKTDLLQLQKDITSDFREMEEELKSLKTRQDQTKLDILAKFYDSKERTKYLDTIETLLKSMLELQSQGWVIKVLNKMVEVVESRIKALSLLNDGLINMRIKIQAELHLLKRLDSSSIFSQNVLSFDSFGPWVDAIQFPETFTLPTDDLTADAILKEVKKQVAPMLEEKSKTLNLREDAKKEVDKGETTMKNRIAGLNVIALPIIHLKVGHTPMKSTSFIAGNFPDMSNDEVKKFIDEFFRDMKPPPTPINTGDPLSLISVTIASPFGIGNWRGYDESYRHYHKNENSTASEWNYHVLSDTHLAELPPLENKQEVENELALFGRGLMLEMIERKGSNYYVNCKAVVNPTEQRECGEFITFRSDRSLPAQKLIEAQLVKNPHSNRMESGPTLGNSLAVAVDKFLEHPSLRKLILDVCNKWERTVGIPSAREMIKTFREEKLGAECNKADGQRKEILEKIISSLEQYSADLD